MAEWKHWSSAITALWLKPYIYFPKYSVAFRSTLRSIEEYRRKFYNFIGNLTVTCEQPHPLRIADAGASPDAHISVQYADSGPIPDDLTFLKGTYNAIVPATSNEV